MRDFKKRQTDFSPKIKFSFSDKRLFIGGRSLPEDVRSFYRPAFDWLEEFVEKTTGPVKVIYKLTYFNTASAKVIVDMLFKLSGLTKKGISVDVEWHYDDYDEDMHDVGLRFSEITGMEIKIIANNE